jgi:hypothetical protein
MQFRTTEVHGIFVYEVSDNFAWSEKVVDYYNEGDVIDVDFDSVIETHFTADFLNGKLVAVDEEAKAWAAPLIEMMASPKAVEEVE